MCERENFFADCNGFFAELDTGGNIYEWAGVYDPGVGGVVVAWIPFCGEELRANLFYGIFSPDDDVLVFFSFGEVIACDAH